MAEILHVIAMEASTSTNILAAVPTTGFVPSVKPLHKHTPGLQNITAQSVSKPWKCIRQCLLT